MMKRLKAMLFSLVIIAVGAGVAVAGNAMGGKNREIRGWPKVEGKLLQADTKRKTVADGPSVVPDIRYEYEVNGGRHESTTFEAGVLYYEDRAKIAREINPFEVGSTVTVYYNPGNPNESYLLARPRGGFVVLAGYGVGAIGILLFVLSALGVVKVSSPDAAQ
jgi:hypothetical protein